MLYRLLRALSRIALRWYYGGIIVQGRERIPSRGPLLVVANHPNALVDALVVGTTLGRRVLLTAKATLFDHPVLAPFLGAVGVVPLRRARDEPQVDGVLPVPGRNLEAFRLVTESLQRGQAVLVFPEGISHDDPALAPLRTGAARMALEARHAGLRGLRILPVGLIFEEKEHPRSRVLVRVGEPIDVDAWCKSAPSADASSLTSVLGERLRGVTLNFASAARARRAVRVARALTAIAEEPVALGSRARFETEALIAGRVERATEALEVAPPGLIHQADRLAANLEALEARAASRGILLSNARISPDLQPGLRFVVREVLLSVAALPLAAFGRMTHWIPLRLARMLALHPLSEEGARDQPAMRTIVVGLVLVLVWYLLLGAVIGVLLGGTAAVLWLLLGFLGAQIDAVLGERLRLAVQRARTYLALRSDPDFRVVLLREADAVLAEAVALETALIGQPVVSTPV